MVKMDDKQDVTFAIFLQFKIPIERLNLYLRFIKPALHGNAICVHACELVLLTGGEGEGDLVRGIWRALP